MPYYFVQVGENRYEVYSKATNEKVNIARIISESFERGEIDKR